MSVILDPQLPLGGTLISEGGHRLGPRLRSRQEAEMTFGLQTSPPGSCNEPTEVERHVRRLNLGVWGRGLGLGKFEGPWQSRRLPKWGPLLWEGVWVAFVSAFRPNLCRLHCSFS